MSRKVAIIGYSVRFPGGDAQAFWQALLDNQDLITEVAEDRWSKESFLHPDKRHTGTSYTFAAGSLGDVSGFDAGFFGLSPREVKHMDPQQRMLLEMSWEAMEHAGIPPSHLRGSHCGVFMGLASLDYGFRYADDLTALDTNTATGTTASIAANRISYLFDLHGPSMVMDTACSSSMVAFHTACTSILSGETDVALTGGINLHLHPLGFIGFSRASMLSPTGRCHVFDASGDGYVRSEGGGVLLLKEYHKAVEDGDRILAVVAASGANADGDKSGLTIPNPHAQAALMRQCYERAGITADEITYLEAHGTGTPVGDPIETLAIGEALGKPRAKPLPIGSVKSNLGHLETASGVAGLIKALQIIRYRTIPATIGIRELNPRIKAAEWNIDVVRENRPLPINERVVVGVNSFGFGGANAHVVLTSPPELAANENKSVGSGPLPLPISARSEGALRATAQALSERLGDSDAPLYDLAWSAWRHREQHERGALLWCEQPEQAAALLAEFAANGEAEGVFQGERLAPALGPVFVYSGNGCQWEGMGQRLLDESPIFYEAVREVDGLFTQLGDFSLLDEIEGLNGEGRLTRTEVAQPLLFAIQVGITRILQAEGVAPVAVLGHSVGEVAAAWACGALSLTDAVEVIYQRSAQQGKTAGTGQMTAVALSVEALESLLLTHGLDQLAIAGVNSPCGLTVAGPVAQLDALEVVLAAQGTRFKRLDLDYAFHSPAMDVIEQGVRDALAGVSARTGAVPFISTVTGGPLAGDSLDAEYWWHNIRQPVLFHAAVSHLAAQGNNVFVEIGGHPVLSGYVNEVLREQERPGLVIATLQRDQDSATLLQQSVAKVLLSGLEVDLARWFPVAGEFVELPAYPWQRESFWHPVTPESMGVLYRFPEHPLLGYRLQQNTLTWENEIDTKRVPWLADHQVGGGVVFPGAGYIEMALAAAASWRSDKVLDVEELEILAPLLLEEGSTKRMRLSLEGRSGAILLSSREHASDDKWAQHMRARIMLQTSGTLLRRRGPDLPARDPDFTRDEHLRAASQIGLEYGPAFQAISHGWIDGETVIAKVALSEAIEATLQGMWLHPGILDSAFQLFIQLLKEDMQKYHGVAFVPTQLGRIQLHAAASEMQPELIRVRMLRRLPHSLLAEVEIFASDGQALAVLEGVRFRAIPLRHQQRQHIDWVDYCLTPAPLAGHAATTTKDDFVRRFVAEREQLGQAGHYVSEIEPLLDSLVEAAAQALLANEGESLAFSGQAQALRKALQARGVNTDEPPEVSAETIWHMLLREYPGYFTLHHLLGRFALRLETLLSDEESVEKLALDQTLRAEIWRKIWGEQDLNAFAQALGEYIGTMQASLPVGSRLSVIELGAARPRVSCAMCAVADFHITDVAFVSDNLDAVNEAEQLRERYPLFATALLDANKGGMETNLPQADILVVSLDWFSSLQAKTVLRQIKSMLKPDAQVLLLGHHPAWWLDQIFGLRDDWWIDAKQGQQLSVDTWQEWLSEIGYQGVVLSSLGSDDAGSWLMHATLPGSAAEQNPVQHAVRHWRVIHDANSMLAAEQLATEMRAQGMNVQLLAATSSIELLPGDQLIVMAGFLESAEYAVLVEMQVQRSRLLIDLARRCDTTGECSLWVLTHDVARMFPADQDFAPTAAERPAADAMLWGMCRTLANEFSSVRFRMVDLPTANPLVWPMQALLEALLADDGETEQVLTAQGKRFVPRMRFVTQETCSTDSGQGTTLTLGFDLPGQLRNLYWKSRDLPGPAEGEVTVEVMATGLNFRDVMYALGMLSDEAIENGFSGPTLGLEFSGRVIAIGPGVSDFHPGDDVVGFGPASFSTRVNASIDAIARIPADIDHASAATIPTTFFTVYYALKHLARLEPGERLLIHGAAGGVGIAALQIAQWMGAEVYATVGSQEKRDFLSLMGVKNIYDSRSWCFAEDILADTADGLGVDVVLNSLAGEAINQNLRVLKPFGRFLELGKRDFYENTPVGLRPFRNNISYFGIDSDQLMKVKPQLTRALFHELMALFETGELYPLPYTLFAADQVEEAFRYMQQARQIGKVVIGYPHLPSMSKATATAEYPQLQLSSNSTWLVTGGLSGFGLRTAEWLVSHGVRYLLLLGRSGKPNADAAAKIVAMEKMGAMVVCAKCDVADEEQLAHVLGNETTSLPPIRGVVHAATVYADKLANNLDDDDLRAVLLPKVLGAWHLHRMLGQLDYFVLFSSATTLFGNPGQANYVAANLWLEALAMHRKQAGLPATCVRWGAIDDVGFLARNEKVKDALQGRMGGQALRSADALGELGRMMQDDVPLRAVLELDWSSLARFLPSANDPKYREIAAVAGNDAAELDDDLRARLQEMLATLSPEALHQAIVNMLRTELSRILLIPEEKIEAERSVYDMGFDSLMGVELMVAVESRFGVQLPVMALSEASTLAKLAHLLIKRIRTEDEDADDTTMRGLAAQHGVDAEAVGAQ